MPGIEDCKQSDLSLEHAMSRYLSFASAILAGLLLLVPAATAVETLTITGDQAIVRAKPGVTHPVLTLAPRGAIFPVLETQGEWYKILLEDGREGWITRAVGRVGAEERTSTVAAPQPAAAPGTQNALGSGDWQQCIPGRYWPVTESGQ